MKTQARIKYSNKIFNLARFSISFHFQKEWLVKVIPLF